MDFGRQLADLMQGSEPAETPAPAKRIAKVIDPERLRRLTGLAEAAATFGTGLAASVPAGLAGMAQMIPTRGRTPDINKAAQTVEDVQSALTYLPRTPTGQRVLERGAGALEMLGAPAEYIGEKTLQYTGSPGAATAANVLLDPVNFIGMPGSGKAVMAAGRGAAAAPRVAGEMLQDLMMGQGRMEGQRGAIKMKGGAAKTAKTVYPQAEALERARQNAVKMLNLPENNTPEMRAQAMGYIDYLHGTQRMDRLLEGKTLDPRRATSGPMPYGTTTPELASSYATSKADTSRRAADEGDVRRYFEVAPKDIGVKGIRSPLPVETAWHFMSPEQKAKIRELAPRVGYENLNEFTGNLTVHPEGVNATLSPNQWEWLMKNEAKGNPLTALRHMWYESGQLVDEPEMLGQIYRLAGVNAPISQTKAPWTEAQGVLLGKARITNPIDTSNTEQVSALIEPLKQAFTKDRSKTKAGGPDQWAKDFRYTPKTWVAELEKDLAEGKESYVWTSIPDKVTAELRKLGFDGIIDRSGKGGGAKEPVVIPFDPTQVRSRFAAFDPAEMDKPDLLKKKGGPVHISDNPDTMALELQVGGAVKAAKAAAKAAAKQAEKPAFTAKQLQSTAEKMAGQLKAENPKLTDDEAMKKGLRLAEQKLKWEKVEKPELEKSYGALEKSKFSDPLARRQRNVPEVVEKRIKETQEFLKQPTEPWTPPRKELQAFERERIKEALEGFPGIEQTKFPRYEPARADLGYIDEIYDDPVNRELIKGQIARGLPLGGETFYASLYPLKLAALERGIPEAKFNEFIYSIAPASARNSIMNEMAVGQFMRDMRARGLSLDEDTVKQEMAAFKEKYGTGLPLMPVHREGVRNVLEGSQDLREMLKADIPTNYKIPTYGTQKAGDFAKSMVLDVHESAGQTRGSRYHPYFTEQGGFGPTEYGAAENKMLGIAGEMGIPGGMAQAGRWFGGGELTGLKSPRGDALDLLEKQTAYTLQGMGINPTPRNIRNYVLDMIEKGEGVLMPWFKKEGMPDVRTEKKKGGAVKKPRKVSITDNLDTMRLAVQKRK